MKDKIKLVLISLLLFFSCFGNIQSQIKKKQKENNLISSRLAVTSVRLNINNVSTIIYNNGLTDETPGGEPGFVYPKGSSKTLYFVSGLLWGGSTDGYWAVGGSANRQGIVPGRILPDGTAENKNLPHVRIYRVRSDYKNFTTSEEKDLLFASEILDEAKTADEIYAQYDLDWNQWPAEYGAPYIDKNSNGVYDPAADIPGMSEEPCQTIWYVANDLDQTLTEYLYGSLPMKLEMQATFWAYKADKPLGNTIFKKYKIINRNSKRIDSMYFSMWSDPDVGYPYDDYAGCDTTLNIGYCYNSTTTDSIYGITPPATGFAIIQGPIIPASSSDSARYNGNWKKGFKNLGMTSFFVHSCGATINWSDPSPGNYEFGALRWKNLFAGKLARDGVLYTDPETGAKTKFPYNGDPVNQTGWLDGEGSACGDRTMGSISGPFTMNPGDTQEVVFAQIAAGGTKNVSRLSAISILRHYVKSIKIISDNNFNISTPPPSPVVYASELDNSIVLSWSGMGEFEEVEKFSKGGLNFEGYNVYQLPSTTASISEGVRIATYDLINGVSTIVSPVEDEISGSVVSRILAYGTDSGISRYIKITEDKLRGIPALYNGTKYYFAVTSYGYNPNPDVVPKAFESLPRIISVTPQSTNPGIRLGSSVGDSLMVNHVTGLSEGRVLAKIIDPKAGDGIEYTVTLPDENHYNILKGSTLLYENKPVAGILNDNPIIAGAQIHVISPAAEGLKSTSMVQGTNPWEVSDQNMWLHTFGTNKYKGLWNDGIQIGYNWYYKGITSGLYGSGSSLTTIREYGDVILKFAATDANGTFNEADENASLGYRFMHLANRAAAKPSFAPFIKNMVNYGFQEFGLNGKANVPVAAYDRVTGKRLNVGFIEDNSMAGMVDGKYFPPKPIYGYSNTANEVLFIFASEYSTNINPDYSQPDREIYLNDTYTRLPILYFIQSGRIKDSFSSSDEMLIETYKLFNAGEQYKFTVPAVTHSNAMAKEDVNAVNVFPNPYYSLASTVTGVSQSYITFTHLPEKAKIKILNISGQIIRVIEKSDNSQFLRWDLKTDGNYDTPTGVYIAYIEMPELGKSKILKFAIIREKRLLTDN